MVLFVALYKHAIMTACSPPNRVDLNLNTSHDKVSNNF